MAANVCMPELDESLFFQTTQTHRGPHPLLAGPVDLIRDSGFVGRTSVMYIAPGEKFELGWGPDPELRVHRVKSTLDVKEKALSSWAHVGHKLAVHLSNLGAREKTITLKERVPVSEIDKVRIVVAERETSEGRTPDTDGFLSWEVTLEGARRKTIQVGYTVKQHKAVTGVPV